MGKAEENKLKKRESLLDTAFKLFTEKGMSYDEVANKSLEETIEESKTAFPEYIKQNNEK